MLDIPINWEKKRIIDFSPLQRGFDLPNSKLVDGDYPVVYSNGIRNYHHLYKQKAPGVVTGRSGTIGKVTFVNSDYWPHNTTLWVTEFKGNFPRFIYYTLIYLKLGRFSAGSGVPTLNRNDVHKQFVLVPPLKEQEQIVNILSVWDEAIEKTEKLIELKKKQLNTLSKLFLFGKNFESTNLEIGTKWFKIPKHWKILRIKDIAKEVKEKNGTLGDIPVLSCTKYDGLVNSLKYFDKRIYSENTSQYKLVKKGHFAYATNHIEEGSIGYQNLYPAGLVSPMYTVFKTNGSIHDGYLYKLLKTETYRHIFEVNTSASVNRRGSLRWNQFSKLPIPFPPMDEQILINDILNTSKNEIDLLNKLLNAYKTQKRGLMQKLLTGKWKVKVDR